VNRDTRRSREGAFHAYRLMDRHDEAGRWRPNVDIYETEQALVVVMDLAGVSPDNLSVDVTPRSMTVTGKRTRLVRNTVRRIHRLEIPHGAFETVIDLPAPVDPAQAQASAHDGLLEVILPLPVPFRPEVTAQAKGPR